MAGGALKSWSRMQASVARSSGEAEYYRMVKGAAEVFGIQSLARDLGWDLKVRLWVDSSAARSMASRVGVGKLRHMEVRYLWLQEVVRRRGLALKKIAGAANPADVLTKPKSMNDIESLMRLTGGT